MLKCPNCGSELEVINNLARCKNCNKEYAIMSNNVKSVQTNNEKSHTNNEKQLTNSEKQQLRYFSFYKHVPKIVFIAEIVISFILGIAVACIIQGGIGALSFFACLLGGTAVAFICYFVLKIACSHKLLQIHYLQKIAGVDKTILYN